jgi:Ser/Thr protein kinase RdoA (MazF antagonist)
VIHNDLNFHNVVVAADAPEEVAGILDFGDMVRSPLVCDVAVAAAYHVRADDRPLADAAEYVAAYHAASPLDGAELEVLGDLIATRLAMSVLISGWRADEHPQNREYILRNEPAARAGLGALERLSHGEAAGILRRACGVRP